MANGALGWINQIDTGILTSGSALSNAPISNLLIPQGAEPWVTSYGVITSANGAYIQLDAGTSVSWRAFGLFRTNLSTSATVRYKLGSTPGGSEVLNTGALTGVVVNVNQHVYMHPSVLSARYLTIEINDSANPDNQISVGLVFAGDMLVPRFNFDFDTARTRNNRTDRAESGGGQVFTRNMWQRRAWDINWSTVDENDIFNQLDDLDRYGRMGVNVLFIPDYEASPMRDSVFGEMSEQSPFAFSSKGFNATYTWKANITERL